MSYQSWFDSHAQKHAAMMQKLTHLSDDEIINYFRFENMLLSEPDFCPLYATATKCHDTEHLNCYLCACPNFRFDDAGIDKIEGKTRYSYCSIDSQEGAQFTTEDAIHQDCSGCLVPHEEAYIKSVFKRDWSTKMSKCGVMKKIVAEINLN